jgi:DNA-directed RNA polymerase omega subunit
MSYLNLVEEYPKGAEVTQFEKILVAAKRAKDLHAGGKTPLVDTLHKEPYAALEEIKAGKVRRIYRPDEVAPAVALTPEEGEDDDE